MNKDVKERRKAPLQTPTDLGDNARRDISGALNALLADVFALYLKTKNFHWHVSGPHFRDYHLMFDEQAGQIFAMTDEIAERVRKIGGTTVRSIGNIARLQRIPDNDADYVDPLDMRAELRSDNQALITSLREVHDVCDEENDVAWIDQAEDAPEPKPKHSTGVSPVVAPAWPHLVRSPSTPEPSSTICQFEPGNVAGENGQ